MGIRWTPIGAAGMMVRMGHWRGLAVGVCMLAGAGCGSESLGGVHPTGSGGSVGSGGVRAMGGTIGTGSGGTGPGMYCGEVDVPVYAPARPNILVLLDRSSSMNDDSDEASCPGGCGATSKWALLSAKIDRLVTTRASANWGLALFGSDDACGVNAGVAVDVAKGSAASITQALAATTPGGDAPTAAAIDAAFGYLQSGFYSYPKYILLATDGRSGCAPGAGGTAGADAAAVQAIARANSYGVSTFVLGLAPDWDTTATATLNQMADNGGQAARSRIDFATLDTIDTQISVIAPSSPSASTGNPCVVALPYPLAPGTSLAVSTTTVYGQNVLVPEDPLSGWSFTSPDESAIDISGSTCAGLQNSAYSYVAITYQCRLPPPGRSIPSPR
jgi:hypothetical protein